MFEPDALGSVVALSNTAGDVVERVEYEAYGKPTFVAGGGTPVISTYSVAGNPFGFTGYVFDGETGLYRPNGWRNYDPAVGAFLQEDPLGILGRSGDLYAYGDSVGKPLGNAYAYTYNNPVRYVDPLGLYSKDPWAVFYDPDNFIEAAANFSAGFGDILASGLGLSYAFNLPSLTEYIRSEMGTNGYVEQCGTMYKAGVAVGFLWGTALNAEGIATGYEIKIGKNFRLAPWGNRTGKVAGELPHYHRRPGIGWHRPWERF